MNDAHDTPRDPALSRLYGQSSRPEPPPALDAAILAAARAATTPQHPPRRPWWRRLQAPLALAATALFAIALTLSIDRNPPAEFESPAAAPGKERPAEAKRESPAGARGNLAPAHSPAAASGAPEASAAKSLAGPAADAANGSVAGDERRRSLAAPATPPATQASREDADPVALKAPEAWLEEIRSLRRQGKFPEAKRGLREFRAAYPDYRLPEDLR